MITPELKSRLFVGLFVAISILTLVGISFLPGYGSSIAADGAILIFSLVAWEASKLVINTYLFRAISIVILVSTFGVGVLVNPEIGIMSAFSLTIFSAIVYSTFSESNDQPIRCFQFILTLLLIVAGGCSAVYLLLSPGGNIWLLIAVITTALSDSIAYFAGTKFSGPKLAPTISPNKTWSGAIAAITLGTLLSAFLVTGFVGIKYSSSFIFSICLVASGIVSDLAQSRIKRISGVKDSGTILKGHGGLFDRVDSHLGALLIAVLGKLLLT